MKRIVILPHCRISMRKRGVSRKEIEEAIDKGKWSKASEDRLEASLDFEYNRDWNGKYYRSKRVVPIFKEEHSRIIVITVYSFYF